MTIATRQRLTLAALIVFAAWPLVHHGLVLRYGITPWKFMGFAMYCLPEMEALIEVQAHYGERSSRVDLGGDHMRELRREVSRFITFRQVWGELLSPDRIADVASQILSQADRIEVVVTEGYLDPESWRLAARTKVYDYHPPSRPAERPQPPEGERVRGPKRKRLDRLLNPD